jgi:heme/copper-type cytochrome/quinol oxidase subunit 4
MAEDSRMLKDTMNKAAWTVCAGMFVAVVVAFSVVATSWIVVTVAKNMGWL